MLLIAEGVNHRPQHGDAKGQRRNGAESGTFFVPDEFLGHRPTGAAKFFRPARRDPTLCVQDFVPSQKIFFAQLSAVHTDQVLGVIFFNKAAHFSAEGFIFGCKIHVHELSPFTLRKTYAKWRVNQSPEEEKMTQASDLWKTPDIAFFHDTR